MPRVILGQGWTETFPTTLIISLADAKSHLNISGSDDDGELTRQILSATRKIERDARRSLINRTVVKVWDAWPPFPIAPPKPPLVSVTSITYLDTDDASQTYAASNYTVDTNRDAIHLKSDSVLPSLSSEASNVTLTAVMGYGSAETDIPEDIKHACRMLLQAWWDGCEPSPSYQHLTAGFASPSYP